MTDEVTINKKAVKAAVNKFKHGTGTLARILIDHEAEVMDVCLTEYDEEETMKYLQEEAREEGLEAGCVKTLLALVQDGILTRQQAVERSGMTAAAFDEIAVSLSQN